MNCQKCGYKPEPHRVGQVHTVHNLIWTSKKGLQVCANCFHELEGRWPAGLRQINERRKAARR